MEDGLTDEPEEAVQTCPELAQVTEGLGAVLKQIQTVDHVSETQDQTSGDQGGNQGSKDLRQSAHGALERILVLLCRLLHCVLGHAGYSGYGNKIIIKLSDGVTDDDLKLTSLGKSPFDTFHLLDTRYIGNSRVVEHETHPGHAVRDGRDVGFSSNQLQQLTCVLGILSHRNPP